MNKVYSELFSCKGSQIQVQRGVLQTEYKLSLGP